MASKPIKRVLESIRKGKPIAMAIAESDLDPEEREILVMSVLDILDIVRETKRLESKEEWAGRVGEQLDKIETAVRGLIDHERKTQEAFIAMTQMFEAFITADVTLGALPNPMPVDPAEFGRLRLVDKPAASHDQHRHIWQDNDPRPVG